MSVLQYRVRSLSEQIREFESGEKYQKIEQEHQAVVGRLNRTIRKLKEELGKAHSETIRVRKLWNEVLDDMEKEFHKAMAAKDRLVRKLKDRIQELERQLSQAKEELRTKQRKIYETETLLEEER